MGKVGTEKEVEREESNFFLYAERRASQFSEAMDLTLKVWSGAQLASNSSPKLFMVVDS